MTALLINSWALSLNVGDFVTSRELSSSGQAVIRTGGPFGDNFLNVANTNGDTSAIKNWPAGVQNFFWGFWCMLNNGNGTPGSGTPYLVFISNYGYSQFGISFDTVSRSVSVLKGDGFGINLSSVLATTPPNSFPMETWFFLEIGATLNPDGNLIIKVGAGPGSKSQTILNTSVILVWDQSMLAMNNYVAEVAWRSTGHAYISAGSEYLNDDTGSSPDNTFFGDMRVFAAEPTSNDSVVFTPNGLGDNWQNAAVVPPSFGVDFNSDVTLNAQDTYVVAGVPADFDTIFAVCPLATCYAVGGTRSMAPVVKSASAVTVGASVGVTSIATALRSMTPDDPNTSSAWVAANMIAGAIKVGAKITV
jgi:hypothetical protein